MRRPQQRATFKRHMTSQLRHSHLRRILDLAAALTAVASLLTLSACGSSKASAEGTVDRTFTVDGPAHLQISMGNGDSTITVGAPGEIKIHGDISVKSFSAGSGQKRIAEITANLPVKQQGNLIRVGGTDGNMNNVSIDWTITVPPDTDLHAEAGSGDLKIDGIKGAANFALGSGSVKANNIGGDVEIRVGSGDVDLSNIGGQVTGNAGSGDVQFATVKGNVRFEAGSGDIRMDGPGAGVDLRSGSGAITVKNASGDVRAHTSSGEIEVQGNPGESHYWDIRTTSGDVTLEVPSSASLRLNARSDSGSIDTSLPISMEGTSDKQQLRAKIGDGKARAEVETGSGNITVK
jgi:Putative adhesin